MHEADVVHMIVLRLTVQTRICQRQALSFSYPPSPCDSWTCSVEYKSGFKSASAAQVTRHPELATGAVRPHEVHRAVRLPPLYLAGALSAMQSACIASDGIFPLRTLAPVLSNRWRGAKSVFGCRWTDEYYSFDVEACMRAAGFDGVCTRASDPRHRVVLGLA